MAVPKATAEAVTAREAAGMGQAAAVTAVVAREVAGKATVVVVRASAEAEVAREWLGGG